VRILHFFLPSTDDFLDFMKLLWDFRESDSPNGKAKQILSKVWAKQFESKPSRSISRVDELKKLLIFNHQKI